MSVLKVKIAGQRIKYEIMKVTFSESDLQKAKGWKWIKKGNTLCFCENKLDIIKDYDTFDSVNAGVALHPIGDICFEIGNTKGKIAMDNVLSAINHPILIAIRDANKGEGMTLLNANAYYEKNTTYEYTIEVGDRDVFDKSLFEIISINCPITEEEHIVEVRYKGKKMKGGIEGLPFKGEPVSKKSMLTVPKDYAAALRLGENRKLENILKFDDFIKEDYIHSFIDEHEPDHEPEEE